MKEFRELIRRGVNIFTPGIPPLTGTEIDRRLNLVLDADQTPRTQTYAHVLHNLPEGTLQGAKRILEVGMNHRLLLFKDVLRADVSLFGVTLTEDHAQDARQAGDQHGIQTTIAIHNVEDGLPRGFDKMDLALDIYSATHYAEKDPVPTYVQALKPGGVVAIVPGAGPSGGMADYIRQHPEADQADHPKVAFRHTQGGDTLGYLETPEIASMMRRFAYPELVENPSEGEIIACMDNMASRIGHQVVTNFDLAVIHRIRLLEDAGVTDVKFFQTSDGGGYIGRKP